MRNAWVFALFLFTFTVGTVGQDPLPTFKAETRSAFVWGEDAPEGAVSSTIPDKLTGNEIHTLRYAGIQVTSQMGFEKVGSGEAGGFLGYTTTIINDTNSRISVRYGGISIDGRLAPPLSIVSQTKKVDKKKLEARKEMVELQKLYCLTSGFLSSDNLFSANASAEAFEVAPGSAMTVSSVIRDPRHYSIRCSTQGCYPTGTMRYSVIVKGQGYIFVWPGRSLVYCGQ